MPQLTVVPDVPAVENDTAILVPKEVGIDLLDDEGKVLKTITIRKFKVGKALRLVEILGQMIQVIGAPQALLARDRGEMLANVMDLFPRIFAEARPLLLRALAIICIPDRRLFELELAGESVEKAINEMALTIQYEAEPEQLLDILIAGVDAIGLDRLAPKVNALLNRFVQKAPTT